MASLINSLIRVAFGADDDENLETSVGEVDITSVDEADQIILSCQSFLNLANSTMIALPFQAFSRIRHWRAKRRDTRLASNYDVLYPKVKSIEKKLRSALNTAIEKKNVLKYQAKYLIIRLEACIQHNKQLLETTTSPLEEIRDIVNMVSQELTLIKSMQAFNYELIRLRNIELIQSGELHPRSLTSGWHSSGIVRNIHRPLTDIDLENDIDHQFLSTKLDSLREIRQNFVRVLAQMLEQRASYQANLEASETSFHQLMNLVRRDLDHEFYTDLEGNPINGLIQDPFSSRSSTDAESELSGAITMTYDHERCVDCSIGYRISDECIKNLSSLQQQAAQVNARLQVLVELRERMSEVATSLDLSNHSSDTGNQSIFSADDSYANTPKSSTGLDDDLSHGFETPGTLISTPTKLDMTQIRDEASPASSSSDEEMMVTPKSSFRDEG
jgi:hypothetical protein